MIDKSIEKYEKYFIGLRTDNNIKCIETQLPVSWDISSYDTKNDTLKVIKADNGSIWICTEVGSFDDLFKVLDSIITYNEEYETRSKYYEEYLVKLKKLCFSIPINKIDKVIIKAPSSKMKSIENNNEEKINNIDNTEIIS